MLWGGMCVSYTDKRWEEAAWAGWNAIKCSVFNKWRPGAEFGREAKVIQIYIII